MLRFVWASFFPCCLLSHHTGHWRACSSGLGSFSSLPAVYWAVTAVPSTAAAPGMVIDSDTKAGPGRGPVRLLRVSVDPTDLSLRLESSSQPAATCCGVRTRASCDWQHWMPAGPGHITAAACTLEFPNIMNRIGVPPRVDAVQNFRAFEFFTGIAARRLRVRVTSTSHSHGK